MSQAILQNTPELKIAICEDNPLHLSESHQLLRRNPGDTEPVFSLYTSGKELLSDMEKGKDFDVLFCDIEMPEINGIEIGNTLRKYKRDIILVYLTSFQKYALEAYETRAFRYLLKPLDDKKAKEIMDAIVKEYRQYRKLIFREWDTVHFVNIADILYMEAREKYTFAYTVSQEFSSKTSLNEYDSLLKQNGFFRIHRKYLVNSYYVDKLTAGGLTLSGGIELPVARRQRADFKKLFLNAMERGYF